MQRALERQRHALLAGERRRREAVREDALEHEGPPRGLEVATEERVQPLEGRAVVRRDLERMAPQRERILPAPDLLEQARRLTVERARERRFAREGPEPAERPRLAQRIVARARDPPDALPRLEVIGRHGDDAAVSAERARERAAALGVERRVEVEGHPERAADLRGARAARVGSIGRPPLAGGHGQVGDRRREARRVGRAPQTLVQRLRDVAAREPRPSGRAREQRHGGRRALPASGRHRRAEIEERLGDDAGVAARDAGGPPYDGRLRDLERRSARGRGRRQIGLARGARGDAQEGLLAPRGGGDARLVAAGDLEGRQRGARRLGPGRRRRGHAQQAERRLGRGRDGERAREGRARARSVARPLEGLAEGDLDVARRAQGAAPPARLVGQHGHLQDRFA